MISAQQRMYAPASMASHRRRLMTVTFVLISLSGLLAGISLRQAVQLFSGHTMLGSQNSSHSQSATQPKATAMVTPQLTAQFFDIRLGLSSYTAQAGDTITLSASVRTQKDSVLVQGIAVNASIIGSQTLLNNVAAVSDTNGIATWTIPIPATTKPGSYNVRAIANWNEFSASWETTLTIK